MASFGLLDVLITAILGLLGVLITAIFGLLGAWIGYQYSEHQHRREMGVKMIEIALGILAGKPDENGENKPLRAWAVDVLAHYSKEAEVPLSDEAKSTLRLWPLPVNLPVTFGAWLRGAGAVGASGEQYVTPLPLREAAREAAKDQRP